MELEYVLTSFNMSYESFSTNILYAKLRQFTSSAWIARALTINVIKFAC